MFEPRAQICPFCKKEFIPTATGRTQTWCSVPCMKKERIQKREEDIKLRAQLGLPYRRTCGSSWKK